MVMLIVAIAVAVVVIAVIAWMLMRRNRSKRLEERFGPEYGSTISQLGDRRKAEKVLAHREQRVESLDIRPLDATELSRYRSEWDTVQKRFVDDPTGAVTEADRLVQEVMTVRGYPVASFEQRAADISVSYPDVVSNYRNAHRIGMAANRGNADTEELREGFVSYRALFSELLHDSESEARPTAIKDNGRGRRAS
jgi:hypothetical protein